jgi:endonuclease/exonuclease/phosphatase family metal-dependent hydrolase
MRRARVTATVVAAVLVPFVAGLAAGRAHASGLRIATFNTHLVAPIFYHSATTAPEMVRQANRVADAICDSGYDVVALNEVFDNDLKDALVRPVTTCGYGHYVSHVEMHDGDPIDSGLMIFSRLEIVDFPPGLYGPSVLQDPHIEGSMTGPRHRFNRVAYREYEICDGHLEDGSDCFANKGAAVVRLSDPATSSFYTILFTHLDASGDGGGRARANQLGTVKSLVEDVISTTSDHVFVVGDLNIDGASMWVDGSAKDRPEWEKYFASGSTAFGGFFADVMADAWDQETSEDDPGYTKPDAASRIDYVLWEKDPDRCVQHMKLALAGTGSDHIGVGADVNDRAPGCNPRSAINPITRWHRDHPADPRPDGWNGSLISERLVHPGGMQWFKFYEGGTWSFATTPGSGVEFEVYESRNLTDPIAQYRGETTDLAFGNLGEVPAKKFLVPKPPFYVRVFHPDRSLSRVDYELLFYRHGCTSMEDACLLAPNGDLFDPQVPVDRPLNADDMAWFELDTDAASSLAAQELRFTIERLSASDTGGLTLQLRSDKAGVSIVDRSSPVPPDPGVYQLLTTRDVGPSKFFVTVRRQSVPDPTRTGFTWHPRFRVGWRTNLAILHNLGGHRLWFWCKDEIGPDALGEDEVRVNVWVDGVFTRGYLNALDAGDSFSMEDLDGIRFVDNVTLEVFERDGGLMFGDDASRDPVRITMTPEEDERRFQSWPIFFGADHYYTFTFNVSRMDNTGRAS